MSRPEPSSPGGEAWPGLEELRRLSGILVARLAGGDLEGIEDFRLRRQALIDRLTPFDRASLGAAESAADPEAQHHRVAILREVLSLDEQLLAALDACKARTRDQLQQLRHARCALSSYRGTGPSSPAYLESQG